MRGHEPRSQSAFAWNSYYLLGGETLKPKCFSEAGLPPQTIASKLIRIFRNDAAGAKMTAEFLGMQSLCLRIAVFFLLKSGIAQRLGFDKTLVVYQQLPGRETLRGRVQCSCLVRCSGVFGSGFSLP